MGFKIPRIGWFVTLLAFVFAAVWAFLSLFHSPYAVWLTAETPPYAVAGSTFDVRITLGAVPEPSLLVAGLYFLAKNHTPIASTRSANPAPSVRSSGVYSFRFDVADVEKLALVKAVVYLSPDGRWRTRTHGASTEAIPVRRPGERVGTPDFKKVRVFALANTSNSEASFEPGAHPAEPAVFQSSITPFRLALLALLAAGGLVCAANAARRRSGRVLGMDGEWRLWLGASAILFLAVFWEAFQISKRLSLLGRRLVVAMDVYYARQSYQRVLLALIAAGSAGFLLLAARAIARKRVPPHITAIGVLLAICLGASLAGALSFHYVDVLREVSLAGISLIGGAKAVCAAAVLVLGLLALRKEKV